MKSKQSSRPNDTRLRRGDVMKAYALGALATGIFSLSLPMTKVAVAELHPLFVASFRVCFAVLPVAYFAIVADRMTGNFSVCWRDILGSALCTLIGFPLLSATALLHISSAQSLLFLAILPPLTMMFGAIILRERVNPITWITGGVGTLLVLAFSTGNARMEVSGPAGIMLISVVLCAVGYVLGARASTKVGRVSVVFWGVLLSSPFMFPFVVLFAPECWRCLSLPALSSLAYLSICSLLLGYIFWFAALSLGGVSRISRLQFLQPFIGILFAWLILGEPVSDSVWLVCGAILGVLVLADRAELQRTERR